MCSLLLHLIFTIMDRADSLRSQREREAAVQAEGAKQLPKIFDVRFDGCSPRTAFDQDRFSLTQEPLCVDGPRMRWF